MNDGSISIEQFWDNLLSREPGAVRAAYSMLDKQEQNILNIETLSRLRDTLLPKLVSGEVRVKV